MLNLKKKNLFTFLNTSVHTGAMPVYTFFKYKL